MAVRVRFGSEEQIKFGVCLTVLITGKSPFHTSYGLSNESSLSCHLHPLQSRSSTIQASGRVVRGFHKHEVILMVSSRLFDGGLFDWLAGQRRV